ncbi:phospholipase D-like domain-containing protein [Streptomyces sp. NPDC050095]|uniref:phospholipase D-like domain-containing protein n=1 Tax=unclassified Streptomyces TaxID=2593676 RepID=UPI00341B872E
MVIPGRRPLRRTGLVVASAAALLSAVATPADAATYSAFAFSQSGTTQPVVEDFIASATSTLDMTMYELEDDSVVDLLVSEEESGVDVRVVLDLANKSDNAAAYSELTAAGVGVVYSSSSFVYTHQKTITVDGAKSLILTGNLTSQYYDTGRDFGVFDDAAADVAAIEAVFDADYAHTSITPSDGTNLMWSPTSARSKLVSVINGATKTLDVDELEFSDSMVVNAIVARAEAGVTVRVIVQYASSYSTQIAKVKAAGGKVVTYQNSSTLFIHAKAMVADYGLSTQKVQVGSMNVTANSLDNNRELGIVLTNSSVAGVIETQFASDYAGGTAV